MRGNGIGLVFECLYGGVHVLRQPGAAALQRRALDFWDHIVDGADSIAFRLMYNTLRATYEPALPALATIMAGEVGQASAYRAIAEAVVAGDPAAARDNARRLLEPATTALLEALHNLEESDDRHTEPAIQAHLRLMPAGFVFAANHDRGSGLDEAGHSLAARFSRARQPSNV